MFVNEVFDCIGNYKNNSINVINNNINNNKNNSCSSIQNIRRQLFNLNNLTLSELKLRWFELYKTAPNNLSKNYLVKGIAYKIQSLAGASPVSEEELKMAVDVAKNKLISNNDYKQFSNGVLAKVKNVNLLPPVGSVIKTYYKGQEYVVKVISNNTADCLFEYNGSVYKSLSAIAFVITGVRWNGYTFFKLKKTMR